MRCRYRNVIKCRFSSKPFSPLRVLTSAFTDITNALIASSISGFRSLPAIGSLFLVADINNCYHFVFCFSAGGDVRQHARAT